MTKSTQRKKAVGIKHGKAHGPKKTLTGENVDKILGIIDGWKGKLTYDKLLDAAERPLLHRFTRQALFSCVRIREAIENRKNALKGGSPTRQVKSLELQTALSRITRLEAEVQRLQNENNSLLNQFARWAYNAHSKGLSPEFLNQALPDIDRKATKVG